jgi:protein MpaA
VLVGRSLGGAACAVLIVVSGCGHEAPTASAPVVSKAAQPAAETPSASAAPSWRVIGTSVQGRPLRTLTVGHGLRKVLFIGGIHGDEAEGAYSTSQLPAAFADADLADAVTLTILEDANPDGRAAARRVNANEVDINRNFPAKNFDGAGPASGGEALSQPESRAVVDAIDGTAPELVIVLHSWEAREFINFDGPARPIADRFSVSSGLPVTASDEFAATPGSLGSYIGRDRGIPLLTIELRKGSDPQADWERIRRAVLEAIRGQ